MRMQSATRYDKETSTGENEVEEENANEEIGVNHIQDILLASEEFGIKILKKICDVEELDTRKSIYQSVFQLFKTVNIPSQMVEFIFADHRILSQQESFRRRDDAVKQALMYYFEVCIVFVYDLFRSVCRGRPTF